MHDGRNSNLPLHARRFDDGPPPDSSYGTELAWGRPWPELVPNLDSESDHLDPFEFLRLILNESLRVEVQVVPLDTQMGLAVSSISGRRKFLLDAGLEETEKVILMVHLTAHILLGHLDHPFASILEQKSDRQLAEISSHERLEHEDALALTWAALRGDENLIERIYSSENQTGRESKDFELAKETALALSRLLPRYIFSPGQKFRILRQAIKGGLTVDGLRVAFGIARLVYMGLCRMGARSLLANAAITRQARGIYYLGEFLHSSGCQKHGSKPSSVDSASKRG